MAIDTRNKRASAIQIAMVTRMILPNPFGTIDAAARLQVGWCYKGIAADAPVAGPTSVAGYAAWQSSVVLASWLLWFLVTKAMSR